MADKTDLERAVDEMLSDLDRVNGYTGTTLVMTDDDWRAEYWLLKDKYDQMVSKLEELVRTYCG